MMVIIAGRQSVKKHQHCAFGDKFLIFGMVLGMVIRFTKNIANKLGSPPSGLFAMNQIFDTSVFGSNPK